jgi:hypothetical protein
MVIYTACLRYGAPGSLVSDSGGAYTSNDFEAVCTRLQIQHETIESTKGESYQNLMETHFTIQRWLYDYQFSFARTPAELEQRHQAFMQTYNTTTLRCSGSQHKRDASRSRQAPRSFCNRTRLLLSLLVRRGMTPMQSGMPYGRNGEGNASITAKVDLL